MDSSYRTVKVVVSKFQIGFFLQDAYPSMQHFGRFNHSLYPLSGCIVVDFTHTSLQGKDDQRILTSMRFGSCMLRILFMSVRLVLKTNENDCILFYSNLAGLGMAKQVL